MNVEYADDLTGQLRTDAIEIVGAIMDEDVNASADRIEVDPSAGPSSRRYLYLRFYGERAGLNTDCLNSRIEDYYVANVGLTGDGGVRIQLAGPWD